MIVLNCGPDAVTALAFGPDGGLVIGTKAGKLFRSDGFQPVLIPSVEIVAQSRPILTAAVSSDATWFGGPYGLVRLTPESGIILSSSSTDRTVTSVTLISDALLAVGFGEPNQPGPGSFELFDAVSRESKSPVTRESTGVRAVAAHPPTQTVAWATGGKQVVVWPITKPDKWRVSLPNAAPSLAFHPDGRWLAAAQDWNVLPIDTERKQLRDPLKGHKGRITAVAFHPFDGTLYSTGWDGTVRLWNIPDGTERQAFDWRLGRLTCLALAPDGTRAAAGSEAGKVVIWDVG